jgi:hypothetical protein
MGYTHYWKLKVQPHPDHWASLCDMSRRIVRQAIAKGIPLQYEMDQERAPQIDEAAIRFNGVGRDGHETFFIANSPTEFEFCKTARKPYDAAVVAVLMAAETLLIGFEWSSDGDGESDAFEEGIALLRSALGDRAPAQPEEA